jgi:hypothetical protein
MVWWLCCRFSWLCLAQLPAYAVLGLHLQFSPWCVDQEHAAQKRGCHPPVAAWNNFTMLSTARLSVPFPAGRSWQARTRDWGRGPNSSILFVILYRMRLLLLYGVWVTVLYGAFRAVVDLTTAAGKAGYSLVNKAADLLYGTTTSSSTDDSNRTEAAADAAAVLECSDPAAAAAASTHTDSSTGVAEEGAGSGESASTSSSSSGTFAAANRLKNRPTVTVFEDMMSAVIPVYLMLLGSVVFFASI